MPRASPLDTAGPLRQILRVDLTRVFLIRHGATELSVEDRFAGSTDVKLSHEGRAQVARLAERLSLEKVAAVYASDLDRTQETARILAAPHKLEVNLRPGLREISHGHWEGMTRQEVEKGWPEEAMEWERDPFNFAPPDGESGLAVTARAMPALLPAAAPLTRPKIPARMSPALAPE